MHRKRILHIMPSYAAGGAERLVLQYARLLNPAQYDVYVASTMGEGPLLKQFQQAGIKTFAVSREHDGGRIGAYKRLHGYLEHVEPDLIHSHLFGGDVIAYFLARSLRWQVPWVHTVHNVKAQESFIRRMVWKRLLRRADKSVAVSQAVADFCTDTLALPKKQVELVLNGVEVSHWKDIPAVPLQQPIQLATIGRLTEQKGHTYLLQALALLQDIDWQLQVFGDGDLADRLRTQAQMLGIAKRITWHGIVPDTAQYYPKIDVLVQPSLWEGLSLVVMEGMAAGRCVVASYAAGEELIAHKKNGLLVDTGDASALAAGLRGLLESPGQIRKLGERARKTAVQSFGFDQHIEKIERLYRRLLR